MSWKNTTAGKEFDLDDPHFTTPMSVISGLASGYCERKAAVSAAYAAASWTTDAVKSNTVSRMAANIAINHDIGTVSAYGAGSETFQAPQSWTVGNPAQTKTFMDYFDHDLASLANMYVTRGGAAYNGFEGLAIAASVRASSDAAVSHYAGYTPDTLAVSGGSGGAVGTSDYTGTFVPVFAAGWAVERRDMLEELRYSAGNTGITSNYYGSGGTHYVEKYDIQGALPISDYVSSALPEYTAYTGVYSMCHLNVDLYNRRLDDLEDITIGGVSFETWAAAATVIPDATAHITWSRTENTVSSVDVPARAISFVPEWDTSEHTSACYVLDHANVLGYVPDTFYIEISGQSVSGTYSVSVFLGEPYIFGTVPEFLWVYSDPDTEYVVGSVTWTPDDPDFSAHGDVIICTGGTVTMPNGGSLGRVIIEPGGVLDITPDSDPASGNGCSIGYCCILTKTETVNNVPVKTSGRIIGLWPTVAVQGVSYPTCAALVDELYIDFVPVYTYRPTDEYPRSAEEYPPSLNSAAIIPVTGTTISDWTYKYEALIVSAGATITLHNTNWGYESDGIREGYVVIEPGGTLIVSHSDKTDHIMGECYIMSGGTLHIDADYLADENGSAIRLLETENIHVLSGGVCEIAGQGKVTFGIEVFSGGTLHINKESDMGGYRYGNQYISDGAEVVLYDYDGGTPTQMTTVYDKLTCRASDCIAENGNIRRFHSMNMKCQSTNAAFHWGWNTADVTFAYYPALNASIGTFGASINTQTISVGDIMDPVLFGSSGANLYAGFEVCAIKGLHGLVISDLYPRFTYRKFGNEHK